MCEVKGGEGEAEKGGQAVGCCESGLLGFHICECRKKEAVVVALWLLSALLV